MVKIVKTYTGLGYAYQLEHKHRKGRYVGRVTVEGGYYKTKAAAEKAKRAWEKHYKKMVNK